MDRYESLNVIGNGSYGEVHLVSQKQLDHVSSQTRKCFAMKKILVVEGQGHDGSKKSAKKEVDALVILKHPNIVSYVESFQDGRYLHIVMEFCAEGDLWDKIQKKKDQKGSSFTKEEIVQIMQQLCQAVEYVHSQHVIHRDIKPRNIFFADDKTLKLGDFGIAKILKSTSDYATTNNIGTFQYTAPEIFDRKKYKSKCDMWSLGCVLYELVTLKMPFGDETQLMDLLLRISSAEYVPLPTDVDSDFREFIVDLLQTEASTRPSAAELLHRLRPLPQTDSRTINLLLLGGVGNGKSATGNSILGKDAFKRFSTARTPSTSLTSNIVKGNNEVEGVSVNVIDGPSIHHAEVDQDFLDYIVTSIEKSLELCDYAFNAILIVLKMGNRHTKQEAETIKLIKSLLGENVIKDYGICVVTHGDIFDSDVEEAAEDGEVVTFDSWCRDQSEDLNNFFEECMFRCVLFDNKTKDLNKKQNQRIELLKMVDPNKRYSKEEFLKAEGMKELIFKASLPQFERETKALIDEVSLKVKEIDVSTIDDPELYKSKMEPLLEKLQTQKDSIEVFGQSSPSANLMCQQLSVLEYDINSKIMRQEMLVSFKKQAASSSNKERSPAATAMSSNTGDFSSRKLPAFEVDKRQKETTDSVMLRERLKVTDDSVMSGESKNIQQLEVIWKKNEGRMLNVVKERWRMIRKFLDLI